MAGMKLLLLPMMVAMVVAAQMETAPNVKAQFCNCEEITVESTGGAMEHYPESMGRYSIAGSLWEGMVPFWKNENHMFIIPDMNSNPMVYYMKWVVMDTTTGYNATIMNDVYTNGLEECPFSMDQWTYEWEYNWHEDPTLRFTCTEQI